MTRTSDDRPDDPANDQAHAAEELARAWRTNCAINRMLIEGVSDTGWDATLSTRGGRGVCGELAHMHTNRVWQLENGPRIWPKG